jgi:hypothetical protein
MSKFRTDIENLFLLEMAEEDMDFILAEDTIDEIIPENTKGLFDDTSSGDDDLDSIINGDDFDLF